MKKIKDADVSFQNIYDSVYIHTYTYVYAYIHVCVCVCVCVCIYIYIIYFISYTYHKLRHIMYN